MTRFNKGQQVTFKSKAGRKFKAVIFDPHIVRGKIKLIVAGDPFPVEVSVKQIEDCQSLPFTDTVKIVSSTKGATMATTVQPDVARRLAKEAKMLGIKGFARMSASELQDAVAAAKNGNGSKPTAVAKNKPTPAKVVARRPVSKKPAAKPVKAVAKKAKAPVAKRKPIAKKPIAKKAAAPVKRVATGDNPFREGSNSYIMAAELLKGGNRGQMVKRLKKAMKIHPWSKPKEEDPEFAIRKRMLLVAASLEKDFGFTIEREGRGEAGSIIAYPPGKKSGQASKARASSSKKATSKR